MLTTAQIAFFQENGYLTGLRLYDEATALRYRGQFDALEARVGRETTQIGLLDRHFDEAFLWEIATLPPLLDTIESILGPDFVLLATHFFCKYGHDEKFVAWHQDITYWGLEPPVALTAWVAIDEADRENGCMRVLPGTHRGGVREHGKSAASGNLLSVNQEIQVSEEEAGTAVDLPLRAGEMSLHDGALIHGSLPNRSPRRRCGLTLRYAPAYVRQIAANSVGKRWNPVLVRGQNREGKEESVGQMTADADG